MARPHGHALPAYSALPFRLRREVPRMIIVVMGVAGAGKTTVGSALARALGWAFIDGDDMHPTANLDKMRRGEPLDDSDRMPWLEALARLLAGMERDRKDAVLACSALREVYRAKLSETSPRMLWVYLRAEPATIRTRLAARRGHFAAASLIDSQFAMLEEPRHGLALDASQPPEAIVAQVLAELRSLDSHSVAGKSKVARRDRVRTRSA
jgi:gluconokinase